MEKENFTEVIIEEHNKSDEKKEMGNNEIANNSESSENQNHEIIRENKGKKEEKENDINLNPNSVEEGEASGLHVKTSDDKEEGKDVPDVGSEEWFKEDRKKFKSAYPDLNSEELFSDPIFLEFAEKRAGVESMVDIYGSYLSISRRIEAKVKAEAEREFKTRLANAKASPGSLTEGSVVQDRLYSMEELKRMSPEAIEMNWEKVQKSMKAFGK